MSLPSFELSDYTGERVRSRDLRGKVVLVTFLETKCKEACPIIATQLGEGLDLLDPDERDGALEAIANRSVHPDDDTPANVRRFLRAHRVEGELHYLIGSEDDLRPVWGARSRSCPRSIPETPIPTPPPCRCTTEAVNGSPRSTRASTSPLETLPMMWSQHRGSRFPFGAILAIVAFALAACAGGEGP